MSAVAVGGARAGAQKPGLSLVLDPEAPPQVSPQPAPAAPATSPEAHAAQPEASGTAPVKRAYPAPAEVPTQAGPKGLLFDFNDGCRVHLPEGEYPWRVRLT